MDSCTPPYSMLIAGATGAIGRELVVLAVDSPNINRVVGLSRRSIGADQWPTVFPGINLQAAEAKLTIVAVNWEELANNNTGLAEAEAQWAQHQHQQHCGGAGGGVSSGGGGGGDMDLSTAANPVPEGELRGHFAGHDIVVQAMGTTRSDAGSAEKFRRCDYDYTKAFIFGAVQCNASPMQKIGAAVSALGTAPPSAGGTQQPAGGGAGGDQQGLGAQLGGLLNVVASGVGEAVTEATSAVSAALVNVGPVGIKHFAQVSSQGANANSWFLYPKTKGQVDKFFVSHFSTNVIKSKSLYLPGLLARKDKMRPGEKFIACCCCCIGGGIPVETVAEAILKNAIHQCNNPPEDPVSPQQHPPSHSPEQEGGSLFPKSERRLPAVGSYADAAIKQLAAAPQKQQ